LPEIMQDGEIEGFAYLIMKHYAGTSGWSSRLSRGLVRAIVKQSLTKQVLNLLVELAHKSKRPNQLDFSYYVEKPFERIMQAKPELCSFVDGCQHILKKNWACIPLIFTHGDLHAANFVIRRMFPLKFNVLDWESASAQWLPFVDLYRFTVSMRHTTRQQANVINEYCRRLNIPLCVAGPLVFLGLVDSWSRWQQRNEMSRTADWIERDRSFDRKVRHIMETSLRLESAQFLCRG
jgi:hypothetical protein